jgi:hypothetical protein
MAVNLFTKLNLAGEPKPYPEEEAIIEPKQSTD